MTDFQEYELLEPGVPSGSGDVNDGRDGGRNDGSSGGPVARFRRVFRSGGFASDTAWSMLHDVTQLLVMSATFLLLARQLGKSDYGRYAGMFGIIGPIGGLTWSGVGLAILQRRFREGDDRETTSRNFYRLAASLCTLATTLATIVGSLIIHGLAVSTLFLMAFSELFANALNSVSFSMVQAERGFAAATRLRLGVLVIRVTVVVSLALAGSLQIGPLATGYSIGFVAYGIVIVRVILPRYRIPVILGRAAPGIGRLTATISLPIGAGVLQQDGDKAVLNAYGFASEAGVYGAAFRVVSMGLVPLRALEGAAFQRFLPHDESEIDQHTRRAARYSLLALSISVLIGIGILVASPIVVWALGDEFKAAKGIIPWLLPFLPLTAVSNAPLNGLLGLGKLGVRAGVYTAGAAISLTLYITMIPLMPAGEHWKGAIVGTIVGEAFLAAAGWVALRRYQAEHNDSVRAASETAVA